MTSIEKLRRDYDIRTHVEDDGRITFTGLLVWTDTYRRAHGRSEVWKKITSIMKAAEESLQKEIKTI